MVQVPYSRLTTLKDVTPDAESTHYVIYWCIAFKRTTYNYALQRAVEWANKFVVKNNEINIKKIFFILYPLYQVFANLSFDHYQ